MITPSVLTQGGPLMYLLLLCSFLALACVLERCIYWIKEERKAIPQMIQELVDLCLSGNFKEALKHSESSRLSMDNLHCGIKESDLRKLAAGIRLEADSAFEKSMRSLSPLETLASVTPLIGILGTVLGIIKAFQGLNLQSSSAAQVIGAGLSEALLTTAYGLIIAVPALVLFNYFSSKAIHYAQQIQTSASKLELHTSSIDSSTNESKELK